MLGHSNRNGSTAKPAQVAQAADSGALIAPGTPLTRLSYFDGKLLRASDLTLEQSYLRALVHLSNQAGGAGVVHGYEVTLAVGDSLRVEAGLAIDPMGRLLLLNEGTTLSINKLIAEGERIRAAALGPPAASPSSGSVSGASGTFRTCAPADRTSPNDPLTPVALYLVSIAHAEDYCGQENVYGAICEPACATTSQRPYVVEGIVVQVTPLSLPLLPVPQSSVIINSRHLRSRVASAYFAAESGLIPSLISGAGLRGGLFCLGAEPSAGSAVPVTILGRSGTSTTFLDMWTVRRERIEAPPRRYWASRMALRPRDVFMAQVLQFQCQLPNALRLEAEPEEPGAPARQALGGAVKEAYGHLERIARTLRQSPVPISAASSLGLADVDDWVKRYAGIAKEAAAGRSIPTLSRQVLIQSGMVELPPAGYLPVLPLTDLSVNQQVSSLLGEGVECRFCVVSPDFVPHALEEAQHMDRISLLDGLADPAKRPKLDVLVPDGVVVQSAPEGMSLFEAIFSAKSAFLVGEDGQARKVDGLARAISQPDGERDFHFAGLANLGAGVTVALWLTLRIDQNPFELPAGTKPQWYGRIVAAISSPELRPTPFTDLVLGGSSTVTGTDAGDVAGSVEGAAMLLTLLPPAAQLLSTNSPTIKLSRSGNAGAGGFHLDGEGLGELNVSWEGEPARVQGRADLKLKTFDDEITVELKDTLDLVANPRALMPDSLPRTRSAEAIALLSTALAYQPSFQATAELALFGPSPTPGELTTSVRAQRDWVLFHRRRDKDVGQPQAPTVPDPTPDPTPDPLPARRYRLYVLGSVSRKQSKNVRRALKNNNQEALKKWEFDDAGAVEFEPGSAVIKDSRFTEVDIDGPQQIAFTAIASTTDAERDGDDLALERLAAAVGLAQLEPASQRLKSLVLGKIPAPILDPLRTSGVMVMVLEPKGTGDLEPVLLRIVLEAVPGADGAQIPPELPDLLIDIDKDGEVTIPEQAALASEVLRRLRSCTAVTLALPNPEGPGARQRLVGVMTALRAIEIKVGDKMISIVRAGVVGTLREASEDEKVRMKLPVKVGGIVVMKV